MLNTFSKNLNAKGFFDVDIREGIQSSFKYTKGDKTMTVLLAKDEALISSSAYPGKIWTVKSPKLQQILCHLVVSHFGNPVTSSFKGKKYVSDTLVPVRSYKGALVYKDCTGKYWIDSSCTESNSLAIYDAFAERNGEAIAMMLPWFYPMEKDVVKIELNSSVGLNDVSDYMDFLGYPVESSTPKHGSLVGSCIISSADQPTLFRINSAVKGFFSNQVNELVESNVSVGSIESIGMKLLPDNRIQFDVVESSNKGKVVSCYEANLDLANLIPITSSWGFGVKQLREGISIDSSVVGFQDFCELFADLDKDEVVCEPACSRVSAKLIDSRKEVDRILSSWGIDNTPGYFDRIQHVEVMFDDGRPA